MVPEDHFKQTPKYSRDKQYLINWDSVNVP